MLSNPPGSQLPLFRPRGGARRGAGRKRKAARSTPPHRRRATIGRHDVLHVTLRRADGLPSLRSRAEATVVRDAVADCVRLPGMRVTDYSIQANHLHLVVEADDTAALTRGMRGLTIRLARRINQLWGRRGPVWPSRYHVRRMTTPLQVRRALEYVLHNHRKHAQRASRRRPRDLDWYSTARAFEGFRGRRPTAPRTLLGCARPSTWLRREGWKRHGLIRP